MNEFKNVFPEIPVGFHANVIDTLNTISTQENKAKQEEGVTMKRVTKLKPLKLAAAGLAAALALTVGVGAANGWNYGNIFGMLFGDTGGAVEMFNLGHVTHPEVTNMENFSDKLDLEVLGIAGDDQNLFVIIKLTPKKGYTPSIEDYFLTMTGYTPEEPNPLSGRSWSNGVMSLLHQDEDGIIASVAINYASFEVSAEGSEIGGLGKGIAHMSFGSMSEKVAFEPLITFDVSVDYNFTAVRRVELNQNGSETPLQSIELTPISLRYTTRYNSDSGSRRAGHRFGTTASITLNNGDVIEFDESMSAGGFASTDSDGNSVMVNHYSFAVPFDVSEVYSVTIDGNEFVLD
jgi:hypothetical protein